MSNNRLNSPSPTFSSSSRPLGLSRGIKTFPGDPHLIIDSHDKPSHRTRRHSFSTFLEPFELNKRPSTSSRRKISFMLPSDDFRLSDKLDKASTNCNDLMIGGNDKSKACPTLSEVVACENDAVASSSSSSTSPSSKSRRLAPLKSNILLSYLLQQSFLPPKEAKTKKPQQQTAEEDLTEFRNLQSISNVDLHDQNISASRSISGNSSPRSDFPLGLRFSRSKKKAKECPTSSISSGSSVGGGAGSGDGGDGGGGTSFGIGESSPINSSRGMRKITSAKELLLTDTERERDRLRQHDRKGHELQKQQQQSSSSSIVCRECNRDLNALAPVSY